MTVVDQMKALAQDKNLCVGDGCRRKTLWLSDGLCNRRCLLRNLYGEKIGTRFNRQRVCQSPDCESMIVPSKAQTAAMVRHHSLTFQTVLMFIIVVEDGQ